MLCQYTNEGTFPLVASEIYPTGPTHQYLTLPYHEPEDDAGR